MTIKIVGWDNNSKVYFEGTFDDCIVWFRDNNCVRACYDDRFNDDEKAEFDDHDVRLYDNELVYMV